MLGSFDGADHDVELTEGSLAARAAGERAHATKSHHHQGVDGLGDGLVVTGSRTLDELPEAIELPGRRFVLGRAVAPRGRPASAVIEAFVAPSGRDAARGGDASSAPESAARRAALGRRPSRGAIYSRAVRLSRAIRATAWGMVAAGVAAPLLRKRLPRPPVVAADGRLRRARSACAWRCAARARRDVAVCALQMWAYVAAYKSPHDDADAQGRVCTSTTRSSPTACSGSGELPTRAPAARARAHGPTAPQWRALDRVLVWAHWSWFMVPHGAVAYLLLRHPERFPRAAVMTYAVFNVGASFYWVVPTAPPWYAARRRRGTRARRRDVRRMMVEYGEHFWRDGWGSLYSVFGGNPLAAMPSLHFATSVMAALLLAEAGPLAGALGWAYTVTLGFALVYLGEHYVVDLLAGAALTGAVRRLAPRAGPPLARSAGRSRRWRRSHTRGAERGGARADTAGGATRAERSRRDAAGRAAACAPRAPHDRARCRACVLTRRQIVGSLLFVLCGVGFLYFVLPKLDRRRRDAAPHRGGRQLVDRDRRRARGCSRSPATWCCSAPCSCAGPGASAGARATRSRWPGWWRRGCSPPPAPAASR